VGAGVLGPVFRAHGADAGREVAIKLFRLDVTPEQSRSLADALGRMCTRLPDHDHIAVPRAAGLAGGAAWLACDYVPADSLDSRLRRRSALGLRHALPTLRQIASALDAAATVGIHHGSLHPRDVLVSTTGDVRVTGFGVADAIDAAGGAPIVRRPYTAPERVGPGRAPADPAADVFALAAIAVELLTGRRLVGTGAAAVGLVSGVSEGVDADVCRRALARALADSPADRFSSARAFVEALARAVDDEAEQSTDPAHRPVAAMPPARAAEPRGAASPGTSASPETEADGAPATSCRPGLAPPAEAPRDGVVPRVGEATTAGEPGRPPAAPQAFPSSPADAEPGVPRAPRRRPGPALGPTTAPQPSAEVAAGSREAASASPPVPEAEPPATVSEPQVPPSAEGAPEPIIESPSGPEAVRAVAVSPDEPSPRVDSVAAPATGLRLAPEDAASHVPEPWRQRRYVSPRPGAARAAIAASLLAGLALGLVGGYLVWGRPPASVGDAPPRDAAVVSVPERASSPTPSSVPAGPPAAPTARAELEAVSPPTTPTPTRAPAASAPVPRPASSSRAPASETRARQGGAARPARKSPSRVEFVSRPAGARVYVDGHPVGRTPMTVESMTPGRRAIRFQLDGYRPWSTTVDLAPGQQARVAASLELTAVSQGPR
jgi:serine/threonine-protein kinase